MKRILSIITLALMVVALPVSLVGCGKKSIDGKIVGTWKYYHSDTLSSESSQWMTGESVGEYFYSTYTFNKDKTASFSYPSNPEKNDENLTWKTKGNKIIIKDKDNKEKTFELNGEYLIELHYHDGELIEKHYYEKQ